ncbi:ferric reductase-like transmembrane domain-containing protein [Nakamurella sp.]|uniref:ferric reductase-like transmembrane domain-containing protein n=1 Tax=Nakamurella sp. TaxID=1869182 RepID=UPI00378328C0
MDAQILWFAGRATGAVSLVLFTATLVLGILTAGRAGFGGLPRAGVQRLHRSLSLVAIAFLAVHIVTTIVDGYVDITWWDVVMPFAAGYDPFWVGLGTVAVDLLIAIGITSAVRRHLPLPLWRAVHLTAYAMWPIALLHGWGVSGGDGRQTWLIIVDIICATAVLAALGYRMRPDRHPDTVARQAARVVHPPARTEAGR